MPKLGLESQVVDATVYENTVTRLKKDGIRLPTFGQLSDPSTIPREIQESLRSIDPDAPHPLNLFRVHWFNSRATKSFVEVPEHLVIPPELSGVEATIVLMLGDAFPMIRAHKVLAAYGCLAPRVLTGQYDPTRHRAVWPSTGNYCRGGVAISRIMDCRGVAVLPEGMSQERFDWLAQWVADPSDVIRTPGTESNVKEIYDECNRLEQDPQNIIFNQFCEFGNYLVHDLCTGTAAGRVFEHLRSTRPGLNMAAYVSATGSGGTLAAGDHLKQNYGARIAAVEALECPTLLYNGFGEHNIQGIGDKHVPFIHNVMNTDFVMAISDRSTDALDLLFNSDEGRGYLSDRRGVPAGVVEQLSRLGFSSICNLLASIKLSRYLGLGADDVVMTVATDGAELYATEHQKAMARDYPQGFDEVHAGEVFGEHIAGAGTDHLLELSHVDRERVFNLGYFTWVEQQGVTLEEFEVRRDQDWWIQLREQICAWDGLITDFNARLGA